ncbi:MAG: hypothetical protein J5545_03440 [Bacteroidaceae bacterium]|nr:hypothetical protein [Bacteroidaceae bacterium]
MKRTIFLLVTLLATTFAFGQTRDKHGIITAPPAGEVRYYTRTGGATFASQYFQNDTQSGMATEIVFSEDGAKVYIKNFISHAASGTWVEGDVDGHTITIPLGQMVYWFSTYGLQLAQVKVNGDIQKPASVTTKGNITFTIEGDNLVMQGTSGDAEAYTYDGAGLVYTDAYANEWSYYIDYQTVFAYKKVTMVTPPEELETEIYSLEHDNTGHLVTVGFDGDDVYVQGVSENRIPDAWMKGTIKGKKITFPVQFASLFSTYLLFFNGVDGVYTKDESGYWNWLYYWTDGNLTCDYDAKTQSFSSEQTLLVSNADDKVGQGEQFHAPLFRPFTEVPATPANPSILSHWDLTTFTMLALNVPLKDTEGRFLNPAKVAYRLYVDDDDPFLLYKDEYKQLPVEYIEEVPYLFSDDIYEAYNRSYIYEKASYLYLFQRDLDRLGIQTIYRGGGEEHRSEIVYYYFNSDGVQTPAVAAGKHAQHFDLTGRQVPADHKGLTITRNADGRVVKRLQR